MKKEKLSPLQFAITVSGYDLYKENTQELITDMIASTPTLSILDWSTGHKARTIVEMNVFDTDVTWSNVSCVTDETGDNTSVAPRYVSMVQISDREKTCIDLLSGKIPMFLPTGANMQELGSELTKAWIDGKIAKNAKQLEKAFWQGDTNLIGASNNLNKVNGILKLADSETGALGFYDTITATDMNATNIEDTLRNAISQMPAELAESGDAVINLSVADYYVLQSALLAKYGIGGTGSLVNTGDVNQSGAMQSMFVGTNVKVRALYALDGNGSVFITRDPNLQGYTDLTSDYETIDIFFDKGSRSLITDLIFTVGFTYARPSEVVYLKKVAS